MSENATIIQIDEGTWRIENGMVRCYLLAGAEQALLVDTGMTLPDARAIAEGLTDRPVALICTHGDPDHISGNAAFPELYMSPAEEENYRAFQGPGTILPVRDGDVLDLGGREIEIIDLPGHTPGSIALLDRSRRALISGDSVQNGGIFMFGPGRDLRLLRDSLRKLQRRTGEFDAVWPAHGSFPVEPALVGQIATGAEKVLAGLVTWTPQEMRAISRRVYDVGCAKFLME